MKRLLRNICIVFCVGLILIPLYLNSRTPDTNRLSDDESGTLTVTVADLGKADAILLQSGDGAVIPAMIKYVKSRVENVQELEYQVAYTDGERVNELVKQCKKEFGHPPVNVFQLGCVVSANTGPDALAITFLGKDRGPRS